MQFTWKNRCLLLVTSQIGALPLCCATNEQGRGESCTDSQGNANPTCDVKGSALIQRRATLSMQKAGSPNPYERYYGWSEFNVSACTAHKCAAANDFVEQHDCRMATESGEIALTPSGGCCAAVVVCPPDQVPPHSVLLRGSVGETALLSSGVPSGHTRGAGVQADDFYGDWRTLDAIVARIEALVSESGGTATLEELSPPTTEARTIKAVRLRGAGYQSGMPRVVASFLLHAREWISAMSGVYAVEHAISAARQDPALLQGAELILIPVSNPDGFEWSSTRDRYWRKNRRVNSGSDCKGVDLNRNWDKDWRGSGRASTDPCSDVYTGTGPRSEPESQAIAQIIQEAPTSVHLDVHSFGRYILGPWGYTDTHHPNRSGVDDLGERMRAKVLAKNGRSYQYGAGCELLYCASGIMPDYTTDLGALGYTYELSPASGGFDGFNPPPSEILPTAEEAFEGVKEAVAWAKERAAPRPPPA